ncbi:MAG: ABC transporter ATP-binding protein [Raoultibacter sp.]|jgi:ATP-binding cassette subfamily B protein IrtB
MILTRIDQLAGMRTGVKLQAILYVLCGLLEGSIYVLLLSIIRFLVVGEYASAGTLLIVSAALAIAYCVVSFLADNRGYFVGIDQVVGSIQKRLGNHIARLPLGWFTKEKSGQIATLLTKDMQMVMNMPSMFLKQMVLSITTPCVVAILFFFIDWRIGLAFAILTPLLFIGARLMSKRAGDGHREEEKANAELAARVLEFAHAQPVLRASQRSKEGWSSLKNIIEEERSATVRTLNTTSRPITFFTLVIQAMFALVFIVSCISLSENAIDVASFIFVAILALRFTEPLQSIGQQGMALRVASNALDAAEEILVTPPLPEATTPQTPLGSRIEFSHVGFSYDGKRTVLEDVNLSCADHSMTALVGPSGSGKTTLTRLIARFWDVSSGSVSVGGVDVRDMSTETLMQQISMVFQDVYLFDGTIEDNIRLGRPEASKDEVRAAAKLARLDEVVSRLEHGWDTSVGEGGSRLSGGERQRVSIARALLKDAPIVLFDEATAALDAENEAAITAAMHELAKSRTVIVIAHRLSTVASADQIAVLEDGRITQLGPHSELIQQVGRYRSFWHEREQAEGWRITDQAS